jgi:hypothetical protein
VPTTTRIAGGAAASGVPLEGLGDFLQFHHLSGSGKSSGEVAGEREGGMEEERAKRKKWKKEKTPPTP